MNQQQPVSRRTIAVLGASADRRKYGNKCVRAYLDAGWRVLPVNPNEESIEGLPAHDTLASLGEERVDRISVYLPPPVTERLLDEMAAQGADEVWFNPGSATRAVVEAARERGITAVDGCSIVDIGKSPSQYPA